MFTLFATNPAVVLLKEDHERVKALFDRYGDEFRACTYETFAEMREHDPVFCQPGLDGTTPIWFVTRYEDAVAVLLDDERFVRDIASVPIDPCGENGEYHSFAFAGPFYARPLAWRFGERRDDGRFLQVEVIM